MFEILIYDNPPCKDCADRAMGCHGKCEKYKQWRFVHEQRLDEIQAAEKVRRDLTSTQVQFSEQCRKSHLRQRKYR